MSVHELVEDRYFEVRYVTMEAAGGSKRIWLSELPAWLAAHPGTLIVSMRELS